jgi:hypothetical protein
MWFLKFMSLIFKTSPENINLPKLETTYSKRLFCECRWCKEYKK